MPGRHGGGQAVAPGGRPVPRAGGQDGVRGREPDRPAQGARRSVRLAVGRGVRHPGQRPVDRPQLLLPDPDCQVVVLLVLGAGGGQHQVLEGLQRLRADRLPLGDRHRLRRHPPRRAPRHRGQAAGQGRHHLGVIRLGHPGDRGAGIIAAPAASPSPACPDAEVAADSEAGYKDT